MSDEHFMREAVELARANINAGGAPFGAVLARDGKVVARAVNEVHTTNDPTAHAEMQAIRQASHLLATPDMSGAVMYASGHPCPMCMAAMRMAGVTEVAYAYSNDDGEPFGLSTAAVYADLARPFAEQSMKIRHLPVRLEGHVDLYAEWQRKQQSGA